MHFLALAESSIQLFPDGTGKSLTLGPGLAKGEELHPMQEAFIKQLAQEAIKN